MPRPSSRRGFWLFVAGVLAGLALAAYAAYRYVTRESSTPASVTAAVRRFAALPSAERTLPPALRGRAPQPGVYVYATSGYEVSHVLGMRRHAYPAHTTITVAATRGGCLATRWDVLATRWDGTLACPRAGDAGPWRLATQSEEHEFVDHVDRRTYACAPGSLARPARLVPGVRWTSSCAIAGTTTADATTALGARTLSLDGRHTRTLLLRTTTRVSGETTGAGTTFTWVLPGSGLVVKRTIANASATGTIVGTVRYEERATLVLESARPRR